MTSRASLGKIDGALRAAKRELRAARKAILAEAGKRMARGDAERAQALAAQADQIEGFSGELEQLISRWREVRRSGRGRQQGKATPIWRYYQPILRAIVEAGGEATQAQLEPLVEAQMHADLLEADLRRAARGRPLWQSAVARARRPMTTEGWIDARRGPLWRITALGRKAAEDRQADAKANHHH